MLGERVQEDEHDSIEDARTSLRLYRRYEEATRNGNFEALLESVFQRGAETHWYVENAAKATAKSVSPEPEATTPPLPPMGVSPPPESPTDDQSSPAST